MKILGTAALHGHNVHHDGDILRAMVEDAAPDLPDRGGLTAGGRALFGAAPVWRNIEAALDDLDTVPDAGRPHLLAALAAHLQRTTLDRIYRWWAAPAPGEALWRLLVEFDDAMVARAALDAAAAVAGALTAPSEAAQAAARRGLDALARDVPLVRFDYMTTLLAEAARARDVPVAKLLPDRQFGLFGRGARSRRLLQCFGDRTSGLAARISGDKAATNALLARHGIPVPMQRLVRSRAELDAAIRAIGFPLVVKGRTVDHGLAVTTNITTHEELERGLRRVREFRSDIVIERHVPGDDHRFTVVDGRIVAGTRRVPPQVVGDGQQTVQALVDAENLRRREIGRYAEIIRPLVLDEEGLAMLARLGLTPDSVPARDQSVRLRGAANMAQGGLGIDVTDAAHPRLRAVIERAARVVGLDLCGIDVLCSDLARPLEETGGVVIEVNCFPGLRAHYIVPTPPRDVAGAVIDYLFPAPERGRIPVVAVAGSLGAGAAGRQVADRLAATGLAVGCAVQGGLAIAGLALPVAGISHPAAIAALMDDRMVEAAVIEMARGDLLRHGTVLADCEVAILTRIDPAEIGSDGLATRGQLLKVYGLPIRAARRAAILDAADPLAHRLAAGLRAPVWWIAADPAADPLAAHGRAGGDAVICEGDDVLHLRGAQRRVLGPARELAPAGADGGREAALAALAACLALAIPLRP